MKLIVWHPLAREAVRAFPVEIKKSLGKTLLDLQYGCTLSFPLSRPMSSVAQGVEEVRLKDASGIYRVFYFKKSQRGILVFHAFVKKTNKTPKLELELGRKRLKEIL